MKLATPPDTPLDPVNSTGESAGVERTRRVLVVDDERLVLSVVMRMLRRADFNVVTASNAEDAEEAFNASSTPFDLVLTDIVMPGRDGVELAHRLRESHEDLPIVFMSGWSSYTSSGVPLPGPLITKPFTATALLATIERALPAATAST